MMNSIVPFWSKGVDAKVWKIAKRYRINTVHDREFCIRRWWSDVNREEADIVERGLTFSISYFGNELRIINVI